MPTLIIGYGNTLRGDDGLGWQAADALRGVLSHRSDVQIVTCQQLTPDLAEAIHLAERVILIDARTASPAGLIQQEAVIPDTTAADTLHHHTEPALLLACAQALYGSVPPTTLFTVNAATFDYSEALSPAVETALPELVAQILQTLP